MQTVEIQQLVAGIMAMVGLIIARATALCVVAWTGYGRIDRVSGKCISIIASFLNCLNRSMRNNLF